MAYITPWPADRGTRQRSRAAGRPPGGFDRILLPVERPELTAPAVTIAARLLSAAGSVVVLAAVDSTMVFQLATMRGAPIHDVLELLDLIVEQRRAEARERIVDAARLLRDAGVRHVSARLVSGELGPAVVRMVDELACDAVVIARPRTRSLFSLPWRSVSGHVVRHLPDVPVVLVGAPRRAAHASESAGDTPVMPRPELTGALRRWPRAAGTPRRHEPPHTRRVPRDRPAMTRDGSA